MVKGFKATLFAGAITLGAFAPAYAAAPVISGLPDIQIGDMEDAGSTDSNLFVFSNAFTFGDYVTDADTPDNQLKWSFGEFSSPNMSDSQYAINGVTAVNKGTTAIGLDEAAGNVLAKNPGANQINSSETVANFRDIVFSPLPGSGPFPDPVEPAKSAAAAGKVLRFYVADPQGGLDTADILIKTVDDQFDVSTGTDGYEEVLRDENFTTGWVPSGIPTAEANSSAGVGQLNINVLPAQGRFRIVGWVNNNLFPYDSVATTKFVRGKFYVSASNAASAPLNEVPNFRLRVTQEGAVNAAAHFEYVQTGHTDPGYEPFYVANSPDREPYGAVLRPSANAAVPSLYKVDLDPVDVPNAAGSNIGALIESYTVSDPSNGTLSLLEFAMGTYDALQDADGTLLWEYNRATGLAGGAGGAKDLVPGAFNAENTAEPGRRHALQIPPFDPGSYAVINDNGAQGIVADTDPVPQNVYGIGIVSMESTNNTDKLRIAANTLYKAKFYATSSVPTDSDTAGVESQANMRFRFQTVTGSLSYLTELASVAGFDIGGNGNAIAVQALPGVGSQNPDTDPALNTVGEAGGWYSIVVPSPLDPGAIRQDLADNFGVLASDPGPGAAGDSAKDVTLGVDLIQMPSTLDLGGGLVIPFARENRAHVRLSAIKVYSYPSIDDGGYDF